MYSTNFFSYKGDSDFDGNYGKSRYKADMYAGDVNIDTLYNAAEAAKKGDLAALRSQFAGMTERQKRAVLSISFDTNHTAMGLNSISFSTPYGTPAEVAQKCGHNEVAQYLRSQEEALKKTNKKQETSSFSYSL